MAAPSTQEITKLLQAWSGGDRSALDKLTPLVYEELRRLAHRYLRRERKDLTLQTSAMVNEAYLRLIDWQNVKWENRAHFFAAAAQIMRHILVDLARSRRNAKRGGDAIRVSLSAADVLDRREADLVALDEGLDLLGKLNPRQCQVVEMRFFGGLSIHETAEVLRVSRGTVRRDWTIARAWLYRELSRGERP
jgi:RNA polymerase sigma-70 factor, ECF subfamily